MAHLMTDWRIQILLIVWVAGAVLMLWGHSELPEPRSSPSPALVGIVLAVGWPFFWALAVGIAVSEGAARRWRKRKRKG
jgi:hypothetical protein